MGKIRPVVLFTLILLFGGVSCFSAPPSPARIVGGFLSNAFSLLMKWSLPLVTKSKTAMIGRPLMKFEGGYNVETVFDGSKLGIDPYSVEVLPDGDLLILDSDNSNLYKISSYLSLYSRPRLVSGSADGYIGHVDGKLREARMNHPKGLAVDDRGNIYVADTDNMVIRKISDTGVTTIAGGRRSHGGGDAHVDGPSQDAKFSNDFDVVYLGTSCSLLVIDRGNKAIREIPLNFNDCAYQYRSGLPFGIAALVAAAFFGYMVALLQRRIGSILSSRQRDHDVMMKDATSEVLFRNPSKKSSLPPLIPIEDEHDESFIGSLGRMTVQTGESATEIIGGVFPETKTKGQEPRQPLLMYSNTWPMQESFVIPDEDEPPVIEAKTPTPNKTYAFMSTDSEKMLQLRQSRALYLGWDIEQRQKPQQEETKKHHHRRYRSSLPQTNYEHDAGTTMHDKPRQTEVAKPLDNGHENTRSRFSYMNARY